MNKRELIARVQRYMGVGSTRETATAAVNAVLSSIAAASHEEKLQLKNFGSFYLKEKPARKGHHPLTGDPLSIPACRELAFHSALKLEEH